MDKWKIKKEKKGMFSWKAVSPSGHATIRSYSFARDIKNVSELTKEKGIE